MGKKNLEAAIDGYLDDKDAKWGFKDKAGKWVIKPQFDFAKNFVEGTAIVKKDGKYGLISEDGTYIHEPKFDKAYSWEDLIIICVDNEWGFLSRSGEEIQSPYFGCIEMSEKMPDYLEAWFDGDKYYISSGGEWYDADELDFEDEDEDEDDEDWSDLDDWDDDEDEDEDEDDE